MKSHLYVVYDKKTNTYSVPYHEINDASAIRKFGDSVNQKENSQWNNHSEDFSLFKVGIYDDESASIKAHNPEFLIEATSVKA